MWVRSRAVALEAGPCPTKDLFSVGGLDRQTFPGRARKPLAGFRHGRFGAGAAGDGHAGKCPPAL
jgi:hypothetical protein